MNSVTALAAALSSAPAAVHAETAIATIPVARGVWGLAINPNTNRIYAASSGAQEVSVIDGSTDKLLNTIDVGFEPYNLFVDTRENRVYVSGTNLSGGGEIASIDATAAAMLGPIPLDSAAGVANNSTTLSMYVAEPSLNAVAVFEPSGQVSLIPVGKTPSNLAIDTGSNRVYVTDADSNAVSVIDGGPNTVVATIPTGTSPVAIALSSATGRLYVTNYAANTVSVIDPAAGTVVATIAVDNRPSGVAVNPTSQHVYVSNQESDSVSIIDEATDRVIGTQTFQTQLLDVAYNPASNHVYVTTLEGSSVLDFADSPQVVLAPAKPSIPISGITSVSISSFSTPLDTTPPSISAAPRTQPNAAGWYSTPVTVHFTCSDSGSGIAKCPLDQVLTTDGRHVSSTAQTATDVAGNTSAASNVVTAKIDRTAPTSVPTVNLPDGNGNVVVVWNWSDALSGIDSASCPVYTQANINTTPNVIAKCSDLAGNIATALKQIN